MTVYKSIDKSISMLCENCLKGRVSLGEFQTCLLENISEIISLEDKRTRNALYDLEAKLDGIFALYYGGSEIGNLNSKFLDADERARKLVEPIIQKILSVVEYK